MKPCAHPGTFEVTMGTTFGRAHGGWKVCAAHALALVEVP